jgi:hypothetical protein
MGPPEASWAAANGSTSCAFRRPVGPLSLSFRLDSPEQDGGRGKGTNEALAWRESDGDVLLRCHNGQSGLLAPLSTVAARGAPSISRRAPSMLRVAVQPNQTARRAILSLIGRISQTRGVLQAQPSLHRCSSSRHFAAAEATERPHLLCRFPFCPEGALLLLTNSPTVQAGSQS